MPTPPSATAAVDAEADTDSALTTPPALSFPPKSEPSRTFVDLSNGVVLDPKERADYRAAMSALVNAMTSADRRVAAHYAIGIARNIIDDALMTSPVPTVAEKIIMAALDELIKELAP